MKLFKLGVIVTELITQLPGALSHAIIDADGRVAYYFQPSGLNPKDGTPLDRTRVTPNRVIGGTETDYTVPLEVLNTNVKHIPTGFEGGCIGMILHSSGCVHLLLQPKDLHKETGQLVVPQDFTVQECTGEKLPAMTEAEVEKEKKVKPSPSGGKFIV